MTDSTKLEDDEASMKEPFMGSSATAAAGLLRERLDCLEQELHHARTHAKLRRCFWIVFIIHAAPTWLFYDTIEKTAIGSYSDASRWVVAMPLSGIGVLAVWYAWANRSLLQRLSRALLAVGAIGLGCRVSYYSESASMLAIGLVASFALLGAFFVSYGVTWITRVTLTPPVRNVVHRSRLSIKSILLTMSSVAIPLAWAKSMNYRLDSGDVFDFLIVVVCGMMAATLTALVMVCVMRNRFVPVFAGLVATEFAAVTAHRGQHVEVANWLWGGLMLGLLTMVSAVVLKHHGYRLEEPSRARSDRSRLPDFE